MDEPYRGNSTARSGLTARASPAQSLPGGARPCHPSIRGAAREATGPGDTFGNVRSRDLIVGERYRLAPRGRAEVRVLETPSHLTFQARVCVRFESGVKKGETGVVPTVRILEPVRPELAPDPPAPRPRPRLITRQPRAGDNVTWKPTGELLWCVVSIDEADIAEIRTTLFDQEAVRAVPATSLRVTTPERPRLADEPPPDRLRLLANTTQDAARTSTSDSPSARRTATGVDGLLEDIVFSPECVEFYRRRLARDISRSAAADHLRDEVRRKGTLARVRPASEEYIRIRVPGRFEIVLHERPVPGEVTLVTFLRIPKHGRQKRRSTRKGTRAA